MVTLIVNIVSISVGMIIAYRLGIRKGRKENIQKARSEIAEEIHKQYLKQLVQDRKSFEEGIKENQKRTDLFMQGIKEKVAKGEYLSFNFTHVVCPACGNSFAINKEFMEKLTTRKISVYCPYCTQDTIMLYPLSGEWGQVIGSDLVYLRKLNEEITKWRQEHHGRYPTKEEHDKIVDKLIKKASIKLIQ